MSIFSDSLQQLLPFSNGHSVPRELQYLIPLLKKETATVPGKNILYQQRWWHLVQGSLTVPKCKMCSELTKWKDKTKNYSVYCSNKCSNKDPDMVTKIANIIAANNNGKSVGDIVKEKQQARRAAAFSGHIISREEAAQWTNNTTELNKHHKHNQFVADIKHQTSFLRSDASLPQRLWHISQEISAVPKCKVCISKVSWDRRLRKYKTYCGSPKCWTNDPDIIRAEPDQEIANGKRTNSIMARYGVTNYSLLPENKKVISNAVKKYNQDLSSEQKQKRHQQIIQGIYNKYGVTSYSHTFYDSGVLEKLQNKDWLHNEHYTLRKTLTQIAQDLNIQTGGSLVARYLRAHGLVPQSSGGRSTGEQQIATFISSLGENILTTDRKIIGPKELDIVIPNQNLAIEYCGLYWHSEQAGKDKNYHRAKYDQCKKAGLRLLTIYSDEWVKQKDIIKSTLVNILCHSTDRIYARNTTIQSVDITTAAAFFNTYHIQGNVNATYRYGLSLNGELVALMTLNKDKQGLYLSRYCSKNVQGGFSKLLHHTVRHHLNTPIYTFADHRWSNGDLYLKNGFTTVKELPPDYSYSPDGHNRFHKFNYRHKNLGKILENYDPELSETANCDANGILRIWDCGKTKYVFTP